MSDNQNQPTIHPQPSPLPLKKKSYTWVIFVVLGGVILLGLIAFAVVALLFVPTISSGSSKQYTGSEYVAVLHIEGTISSSSESASLLSSGSTYNQSFLLDAVDSLAKDSSNQGIMLYINSPGGEVYATDELYLALESYKEQTGRPIYAYCAQMAASGGYYLAASANKIFINRNCITGSIGVTAGTYLDITGFLEKQGIKATSVYVGKNKTMGSYFEEFTPEQKAIYESVLQETYDQFVDIVASGRHMTVDQVEPLADGRIYSAKQAVANGLVDAVATYAEAQSTMEQEEDLQNSIQFVDYFPTSRSGLSSLFGLVSRITRTDLESYLSYVELPVKGPAYYYIAPK